ncbi:MAG: 50S ribosomal protein L32 [Candidatus Doudnabacteria bacterium]|nr:50S ribosomal protein L32 [Candidatus Doudnabacteria bacterium]
MGVPRAHKTHGATGRRRSHLALTERQLARCANCGAAVLPHIACSACGYYKGRQVFKPKVKKKKVKK